MSQTDGYGSDSLVWVVTLPNAQRTTTYEFHEEYKRVGKRALELLNAGKRCAMRGGVHTTRGLITAVQNCAAAITLGNTNSDDPRDWASALERMLKADAGIAESSRWTYFNNGARVLREVERYRGGELLLRNPFEQTTVSQKPLVHGDALIPMFLQARKDAYGTMQALRSPAAGHLRYIEELRSLAAGALFIPRVSTPESSLVRRWKYATGLDLKELIIYLYPWPVHLVPFFILLSSALAANPDSLSALRRSRIEPKTHPSRGPVLILDLEKARAGEIPQVMISDSHTLSEGALLRFVMEITEPLVKLAPKKYRDYVFLTVTNAGNVMPLIGANRSTAMRTYLDDNNLPRTTLKSLRSARLTDEMLDSRDPLRVWRLSGNVSLTMTAAYVIRNETSEADARKIAQVQHDIFFGSQPHEEVEAGEEAALATHRCKNVSDPKKQHDENGFCVSALWPYNDAHFILLLEPKPIAYLLRDYRALCEAEKCMSPARFRKASYAAKKRKIEDDYLPLIDDCLRHAAEALIPSLPKHEPILEVL